MYSYTYPITRYQELETTITTDNLLEEEDEKEIMDFYETKVSDQDRARIIESHENGELGDTFEYVKDFVEGKTQLYKDLMGDCKWFEGLWESSPNNFEILLGS